jgi:hypothetical protein
MDFCQVDEFENKDILKSFDLLLGDQDFLVAVRF